uniref:Putative secreted protein n=1 Tax=Ixodes ricinus TaxID=34613 RepID=A0A6B0V9X0_IXORI
MMRSWRQATDISLRLLVLALSHSSRAPPGDDSPTSASDKAPSVDLACSLAAAPSRLAIEPEAERPRSSCSLSESERGLCSMGAPIWSNLSRKRRFSSCRASSCHRSPDARSSLRCLISMRRVAISAFLLSALRTSSETCCSSRAFSRSCCRIVVGDAFSPLPHSGVWVATVGAWHNPGRAFLCSLDCPFESRLSLLEEDLMLPALRAMGPAWDIMFSLLTGSERPTAVGLLERALPAAEGPRGAALVALKMFSCAWARARCRVLSPLSGTALLPADRRVPPAARALRIIWLRSATVPRCRALAFVFRGYPVMQSKQKLLIFPQEQSLRAG